MLLRPTPAADSTFARRSSTNTVFPGFTPNWVTAISKILRSGFAHFARYEYTPSIEGDFWYGHHYEMFRMASTFREMVKTRKEPIPHDEIVAVTAIVHAGAKSLKEKSRLVELAEVS